ncbi:MAG: azurin [Pseudomonas sp.]
MTPADDINVTLDGYRMDIDDMIYATSTISVTDAIREQMQEAGVVGADTISSVYFFQNAFDAMVTGADLVGNWRKTWGNHQVTDFSASLNYNKYRIDKVNIAGLFNARSIYNFENQPPKIKGNITVQHDFGPIQAMLRANIYGPYKYMRTTSPYPVQSYHSEVQFDTEVSWKMTGKVKLTIGASNLFDNYPQKDTTSSLTYGQVYRDGVVDWLGGYYYARVNVDFDAGAYANRSFAMKIQSLWAMLVLATAAAIARDASARTYALEISGNDAMHFDRAELKVDASCGKVSVTLHHTGRLAANIMGHDWVLAKTADVATITRDGIQAGAANDHLAPGDIRVLAHTRVIGGGRAPPSPSRPAA